MVDFNRGLDALKAKDARAYEDFIGRDITKFCKVFINPSAVSDMILNNISETFNGYILQARGKHVIHMLEEIRTSPIVRQHRKRRELDDYEHNISPEIMKKVEEVKKFSRYCIPHAASDVRFEVENYGDRYIVDVNARTCTCRAWDISGIPCIHVVSAIHLMRQEAADFCSEWFSVAKFHEAYQYGLPPLNGERMWPPSEGLPVTPPAVRKMPGRPKKKRKRNPIEENPKNSTKLRKSGVRMTCQQCFQVGHNKRSCKNQAVPKPNLQKGQRGRPRTSPAQGTRPSHSTGPAQGTRSSTSPAQGTRPSTSTGPTQETRTSPYTGPAQETRPSISVSQTSISAEKQWGVLALSLEKCLHRGELFLYFPDQVQVVLQGQKRPRRRQHQHKKAAVGFLFLMGCFYGI